MACSALSAGLGSFSGFQWLCQTWAGGITELCGPLGKEPMPQGSQVTQQREPGLGLLPLHFLV